MLIAALAAFAYYGKDKLNLLLRARRDISFDHLPERIKGLLIYGIGQKRLITGDPSSGWMHALIFWGFLILLIRSLCLVIVGYVEHFHVPGPIGNGYTFAKDLTEAVVLLMIGYAVFRRLVIRPKRLENSRDAWIVLSLIGILMVTDFLYDGAKFALHAGPGGWAAAERAYSPVGSMLATWFASAGATFNQVLYHGAYWIHIATLMGFAVFLTVSKHMHVITALPNVFFRRLQTSGKLDMLNLEDEDAEKFGTVTIADLSQKQVLDLFTCTECGRCKTSCPTFVTDKPLSLKMLNDQLKHHLIDEKANLLAGKLDELPPLAGSVVSPDTIWACTTCGFCEQACPVFIDQVPRIVEMRQNLVMMEGDFPQELNKVYKGMERNSNPWGIGYDKREDWTRDLDVPVPIAADVKAAGGNLDVLFFVGCMGSFDERNQKIARALAKILNAAGLNFAILGKEEGCTGDTAKRTGNEMLFQELAKHNIDKFNSYDIQTVLTTCPHCFNTIKNEYPQLGGNYKVMHHTELIDQLLKDGKINLTKAFEDVIFHDPCYLGRQNAIYDQPRAILNAASKNGVMEFDRHHEKSFCCGAGGGRMWMEETIGSRINEERVREGLEKKPSVIASGCPFCLVMMKDGVAAKNAETVRTLDIAEIVAESMVIPLPMAGGK
jgi:Fe-S oxidoreductase